MDWQALFDAARAKRAEAGKQEAEAARVAGEEYRRKQEAEFRRGVAIVFGFDPGEGCGTQLEIMPGYFLWPCGSHPQLVVSCQKCGKCLASPTVYKLSSLGKTLEGVDKCVASHTCPPSSPSPTEPPPPEPPLEVRVRKLVLFEQIGDTDRTFLRVPNGLFVGYWYENTQAAVFVPVADEWFTQGGSDD